MTFLGRVRSKIVTTIATAIGGKLGAALATGILAALGVAWLWIWHHFNPQFEYAVHPADLKSYFVALGQVFNRIDKDSRLYCSGGWDQRIAWLGLRKCYRLTFTPLAVYRMTICTHDPRTSEVRTSDQLVALRYFENRFAPLKCFNSVQHHGMYDYEIVPGKDTHFRSVKFGNDPSQDSAFCGCTDDEEKEIARAIGAALP